MSAMPSSRLAELCLLGTAAIWGLTFVVVKQGLATLPPLAFTAWRFAVAAVVLVPVAAFTLRRLDGRGWRLGAALGAVLATGLTLQTIGLERTTVSNVGFIVGAYVIFTPLLVAALPGRSLAPRVPAAVVLVTVGLALLTGAGADGDRLGDALVLVCAFLWAVQILITERAVDAHDVLAIATVQVLVCGVLCWALAALTGNVAPPATGAEWTAVVVAGAVGTAFVIALQTFGQRHAPAERAALLLSAQPVFAAVGGAIVDGDRLTVVSLCGAALILGAVVLVESRPRPVAEPQPSI